MAPRELDQLAAEASRERFQKQQETESGEGTTAPSEVDRDVVPGGGLEAVRAAGKLEELVFPIQQRRVHAQMRGLEVLRQKREQVRRERIADLGVGRVAVKPSQVVEIPGVVQLAQSVLKQGAAVHGQLGGQLVSAEVVAEEKVPPDQLRVVDLVAMPPKPLEDPARPLRGLHLEVVAVLDQAILKARRDIAAGRLAEARAEGKVKSAEVALAEQEFKRMEGLRKSAAFSQARYDDTRQQVRIAEAGLRRAESAVASARADLDLAEINLRDAEIKAPYAGVVTERLTEAGAYVQSGDPVIRMIGDQLLELEADVPFQNLAGLEPGVEVGVALDDGTRHSAVVRAILPSENPLTRTRMVRFVPNIVQARRALAHDQSVTLQIPIGPERQVLSVHKDAVIIQRDQNMVFVALGDEAQARPVVLGEAVGSRFEVRDGLDAGDLAVVRGNERLRPGDKIRIAGGAS